jgi:PAS domain S-box-containing protein
MKKTDLRRRAEARLSQQSPMPPPGPKIDTLRLLHELQVHQIELEMQNAELQECRDRAETLLEKYIDLYDFAPVGYFSLNANGRILEVNLTGAALLGVERSRLVSQSLARFATASDRKALTELLARVLAGDDNQCAEARLKKDDGTIFWAGLVARPVVAVDLTEHVCRLAITDISIRKQAEEDRRQAAILALSNEQLRQEIFRRQAVEDALKNSEQHQHQLLEQSCRLQEELRAMSHNSIQASENEHKRISRDLHDDIAQTLVGINVQLDALARIPKISSKEIKQHITRTKRLVEKAIEAVLQFALDLRPSHLEDLGLNTALKTLLHAFMKRTGIRVHFKTFAKTDQLGSDQLTTLYRIAQTALSNVAQHSQASRVELRVSHADQAVHLDITDNGSAFDVQEMARRKSGRHLGLISMRERAEMMGGTFHITSEPHKGTTVHVQIPEILATPDPCDDA